MLRESEREIRKESKKEISNEKLRFPLPLPKIFAFVPLKSCHRTLSTLFLIPSVVISFVDDEPEELDPIDVMVALAASTR